MKIVRICIKDVNDLETLLMGLLGCGVYKNKKDIQKRVKKANTPNKAQKKEEEVKKARIAVLESIAKKKGWTINDVDKWLCKIAELYPMTAASIVLQEFARILDLRYEGTINYCDKIYTISTLDGKIYPISTSEVKSFRNIAAFRTYEDAVFARKVASVRSLFRNGRE